MWLGLGSLIAVLGLGLGSPAQSDPVAEPDHERPPTPLARMPGWFGPTHAIGLTARDYAEPGQPADGQLAAVTWVVGAQARLAGYTDRRTPGARAVTMFTPELMVNLELGATTSWRDPIAADRELGGRSGFTAGITGVTMIGVGWASPGKAGAYARITVAQRFSARTNANLEGAYWIASLGPTTGLRIDLPRKLLTVLIGGGVEGNAGVQRFDDRGKFIAQLTPVAEFGVYAQPRHDLYVGWVGRGDVTVLGRRYGGQRLHGRMTAEIVWAQHRMERVTTVGVLLGYEATRIDAEPGHPQFAFAGGQRRLSHQLLVSAGIAF